ncbi:MAG TPA: PspC domain-containing protein [Allosphingosinicella sp.]|jgi:phage shock protein PspC (stress-responsive transcriptional regulator)
MQARSTNLLLADDTMFGVCQGLGEDFGVSPTLLRLAFALGLFWAPVLVIGAYLALGAVVLVSRLLAPDPRIAAPAAEAPAQAPAEAEAQPLPLAA